MYLCTNTLCSSVVKKIYIAFIALSVSYLSFSQQKNPDITIIDNAYADPLGIKPNPDKNRIWLITGINVTGYGGSLIIFNNTWYKDFPRTSFHTFNDSKEWLQVDKIGHGWAAYNTGRLSTAMWRWAGLSPKKATLIGGLSGTMYLTVIEFLDGHSSHWGWSWSDMAANIFGSGLFISQELGWKEQRIQYKFSFHKKLQRSHARTAIR